MPSLIFLRHRIDLILTPATGGVWQQRRHAVLGLFDADMAGFRHHRRACGDQFIAIGIVLKKNAVFIGSSCNNLRFAFHRFSAVIFPGGKTAWHNTAKPLSGISISLAIGTSKRC